MRIGAYIEATVDDFINVDRSEQLLVVRNPAYSYNRRFGKRIDHSIPEFLTYFTREGDRVRVPRNFPREEFIIGAFDDAVITYSEGGRKTDVKFKGTLREYQKKFIDGLKLDKHNDLLLEMPTGHGKSLTGTYIAMLRKTPTLILVPTNFLARQFQSSISTHFDAKVKLFSSKDKEIELDYDEDFVILSFDLLDSRFDKLSDKFLKYFGCVMMDEAHRIGADSYHPLVYKIPAKYRIALTATFRRNDRADKVLQYDFGHHYKMENHFPRPKVYGLNTGLSVAYVCPRYYTPQKVGGKVQPRALYPNTEILVQFLESENIDYNITETCVEYSVDLEPRVKQKITKGLLSASRGGKIIAANNKAVKYPSYSIMDNYIAEREFRRAKIEKLLKVCLAEGRKILLLSKRKESLKKYYEKFKDLTNCILIVGGTDKISEEKWDDINKNCRIVFGIDKLAKEGLDIPDLDCLIFEHPMKDTEQPLGRINRLARYEKKHPIAFFLLDDAVAYRAVYRASRSFTLRNSTMEGEIKWNEFKKTL